MLTIETKDKKCNRCFEQLRIKNVRDDDFVKTDVVQLELEGGWTKLMFQV